MYQGLNVDDIWQTTVNLKKVELPVKRILCGETVTPSGTLLNPGSLKFYYHFVQIEDAAAKMAEGGSSDSQIKAKL